MASQYVPAKSNSFGAVYIVEPTSAHTHTAILLHGRGGTGEDFAEELLDSTSGDKDVLKQKIAGWRLVFPSSGELWSTVFEEEIPAWFEAHSLTDVNVRQDLQVDGIKKSVAYILGILKDEIERLGGKTERIVLGGISQGAAIAFWTLLASAASPGRPGAFVAASSWLPFAEQIKRLSGSYDVARDDTKTTDPFDQVDGDAFVGSIMTEFKTALGQPDAILPILSTPIFLSHGSDDAYVDVELGRQARDTLLHLGFGIEWKEYSGAEQEGHWLQMPEQANDIASFILEVVDPSAAEFEEVNIILRT